MSNPTADPAAIEATPSGMFGFLRNFHNRTILFRLGNWIFTTYAFLAGTAFGLAVSVALWFDAMTGQDVVLKSKFYLLVLAPLVLVGLRSFSIILEWRELFRRPLATIVKPGYMLHGGIAGGAVAMWIFHAQYGGNLLLLVDAACFVLPLGEAVARLGCYVYGCCWGRPTNSSFGVRYTSPDAKVVRCAPHLHGVKIHPAQLYALVVYAAMFVAFYALLPYRTFDGMYAALYFIGHSITRFSLEYFREDDRGKLIGPFTHTNFYSALMVVAGVAALYFGMGHVATPVDMSVRYIHTVQNWATTGWVALFGLVFGLAYGVHYKKVGQWISAPSGGMKPNVDELSMGAVQRMERLARERRAKASN